MTNVQDTPPAAAAPVRYWLGLPADWISLPIPPAGVVFDADALGLPLDELRNEHREAVSRLLATATALAQRQQADLLAFMATWVPEDKLLMQASLTVHFVEVEEGGANNAEGLLAGLSAEGAADVRVLDAESGVVRRITHRTIPLDESVRAAGADLDRLELHVCQYYVPWRGDGRLLAVLNFTTPTVSVAADFDELFDAIARTFEWVSAEN